MYSTIGWSQVLCYPSLMYSTIGWSQVLCYPSLMYSTIGWSQVLCYPSLMYSTIGWSQVLCYPLLMYSTTGWSQVLCYPSLMYSTILLLADPKYCAILYWCILLQADPKYCAILYWCILLGRMSGWYVAIPFIEDSRWSSSACCAKPWGGQILKTLHGFQMRVPRVAEVWCGVNASLVWRMMSSLAPVCISIETTDVSWLIHVLLIH